MRVLLAILALLWVTGEACASAFPPAGTVIAADFGATCDGAHDDAAAINAALAVGGHVMLPPGNCMVSVSVNFNGNGATLTGAGQFATTIKPSATMTQVINFSVGNNYGEISDLSIDDSAANHATYLIAYSSDPTGTVHPFNQIRKAALSCGTAEGIFVTDTAGQSNNILIDAINSQNCALALDVNTAGHGNNSIIRNSRIVNGGLMFRTNSGLDTPQGWLITGNIIFPFANASGIEIRSGQTYRIEHNIIDQPGGSNSCIKIDTTVLPAGVGDVGITDNWCGGPGGPNPPLNPNISGFNLIGLPADVHFTGNLTTGFTGYGININGTSISVMDHHSAVNTNGDVNINASSVTLVSPQFRSTVGIASSGGTYCQIGGSITGTVPGGQSCVVSSSPFTTQAGTSYPLAATDCGTTIRFTSNSAITVTTLNSLWVGCQVSLVQAGTGQVTVANGSGATMTSPHNFTKTFGQGSMIGLLVDANSGGASAHFLLVGDGS
jgi:hypothetical protein